jgi:hypothetical protein
MTHPVTIENDSLELEVWPQFGAKITSLVDKSDHFDLLFNYPSEIPAEPLEYDRPYAKGWYAGWDECFPAISPSKYAGYPYDGIPVPDHGEVWALPTVATPTRHGITTMWYGLRFGYRLTRKLSLDGPRITCEYTLQNLAPYDFRFVWALHPLMTMTAPVEIDLPDGGPFRLSHDAAGHAVDQDFTWPHGPNDENFSRLDDALPKNRGWKLYSTRPISHPLTIHYPTRSRRATIEYHSPDAMPAYWGIWINTGGWGAHNHFAIEPTTGRYDQLDRAIKDHSAGKVDAMGQRTWSISISLQ